MKEDQESDDLQDLILAHLDGRLDDSAFERLQARLESDPAARKQYVDLAKIDSELRDFGSDDSGTEGNRLPAEKAAQAFSPLWLIPVVLGAVAVTFFIVAQQAVVNDRGAPYGRGGEEARMPGIAVISAEAGAVWESVNAGGTELREGASLAPGPLILREGMAQIDFFGGASISLSGPAELDLISKDEAVLKRGRLKAEVPPAARGFEIRTQDVRIEDLGTSFGLAIGDDQSASLMVFDGEVRTIGANGESMALLEGDAARLEGGQAVRREASQRSEFPDIADVFAGSGDRDASRYSHWKEHSLELRRDPRLIAYYDFENLTPASRRLKNRALEGAGSELDGGIVGARITEGRWGGKTALDFRKEGDRVRFQIPGDFEGLTLFAWVRIDALDRHLNSLFLTDYFDPNEIHWQISNKGALHFAVSPEGAEDIETHNRRFYSDHFWNPDQSGQWFLLATTVDRQAEPGNGVTHYVNGEPVGFSGGTNREKPLPALRIGGADLGNWSDPIWPEAGIRTLNGRIDEFGLFREPLSKAEIKALYEQGKP